MMGCGQSALVKRAHLFEPTVRLTDEIKHQPLSSALTPLSDAMKFFVQDLIAAHKEPWSVQRQHIRPWRVDIEQKRFIELEAHQKTALSTTAPIPATRVNTGASAVPAADQSAQRQQPFANGTIVRFINCVRLPEFNDQLGRLYDETNVPGTWRIRVLGRHGGQFVTAKSINFVVCGC
jgi:hypothetical protein